MKTRLTILSFLALLLMGCPGKETNNNYLAEPDDFSGTTPYSLEIPPFFPPMDIPANNPLTEESIELGRYLFWEKSLSLDNTLSCGSCHLPQFGYADSSKYSKGVGGTIGNRQAMPLINLGWMEEYFWDGRAGSLEEQVLQPVENSVEMHETWGNVVRKLKSNPLYPPLFEAAFGSATITKERAAKAMASFLRTMISAESKFDKQRIGQYTFTASELRGFTLFTTEGGSPDQVPGGSYGADCFHCHGFGAMLMTDNRFHNNGLDAHFLDPGRAGVTHSPLDSGKFKAPSLRNVELTAPFMHDGRFTTLEQVIEHYNAGGTPSSTIDSFMKFTTGGLQLSEQSKADLIAFLQCLTDTAFIHDPRFQDPH
jgi:cytochrome c peroxidase